MNTLPKIILLISFKYFILFTGIIQVVYVTFTIEFYGLVLTDLYFKLSILICATLEYYTFKILKLELLK